MVGLKTRPIAKLNYNCTEGLPTDDKEGREERETLNFFAGLNKKRKQAIIKKNKATCIVLITKLLQLVKITHLFQCDVQVPNRANV